jgi:serine/threonine protein kinase
MTAERFSRIRRIYETAIEMNAVEREEFINGECAQDVDLREEVERLITVRENLPQWLADPALGPVGPVLEEIAHAARSMEGRDLRGYKVIRQIGAGGMGSVYLAERADGAYVKRVAIKFVSAEKNNSSQILERFRLERQILASLDHPNIARLIDAGNTEEGTPYFVMEFVDGQPIHQWCDERKLSVAQRLELFRTVCSTVQYAHQRLVVHRDLKPGNILVTPEGTVKLLDFGIAKLLDTAQTEESAATLTMQPLMTPEYASPEQAKGEALTTLTDVYSLGVVLYELLTGHRPYKVRSAAAHEVARVISEEEPTLPSEVVATTDSGGGREPVTPEAVSRVREGDLNKLRKSLRGDLDSIVLTTLRKEPARRYSSVEALEEDLRRHLEHRPVAAKPDDPWYRASRFIRRNAAGSMAVGLVAILFLCGMTAFIWQVYITLDTRQGALSFAPVWLLFAGFVLAGLCAAVYFLRPGRMRLAGALAGGVVWAMGYTVNFLLGLKLGWVRSLLPPDPDPLRLVSVPAFIVGTLAGTVVMLIAMALGRRFGRRGTLIFVVLVAFLQPGRDRVWFGRILPLMAVSWETVPFLSAVAIYLAALSIGLLIAQRIGTQRSLAES